MRHFVILVISLFFILHFVSAEIICQPSSLTTFYNKGETKQISTFCNNTGNSTSITLTGETNYISTTETAFSTGTKTIPITLSSTAPVGLHSGVLNFGGIYSVPIFFNVVETTQETTSCSIDIFPLVMGNIQIQQGETKTRNIQISIPACYNGSVRLNGITLQTDQKPIQLDEISLGYIQPGNSLMIPLKLNAVDISTGSYSDTLQFLMYDNKGNKINVPSISIGVLVSAGIQPNINLTLDNLPTCSVDAIEMNINNTYRITCSRTNPNIQIEPMIDYRFIQGLSVSETSSQYIYSFRPKIIGQTQIGASFKYKNALIGSPWIQDIRVSPSGNSPVGSITLKYIFYQDGIQVTKENLRSKDTIIQVVDNATGNIVPIYTLYINGAQRQNGTITLEAEKYYELRASAPAYLDNVINFTTLKATFGFTINPSKSYYLVGDIVNFNSTENGTIFKINSVEVLSPHILSIPGNTTIYAEKLGFVTTNKTIEVRKLISVYGVPNIPYEDWSKGKRILLDLSEASNWVVNQNGVNIASGNGTRVDFKITDYGIIEIKSGDMAILTKSIMQNYSWYKPWTYETEWIKWVVYIVGIVLVVLLLIWLFGNKGYGDTSFNPYS